MAGFHNSQIQTVYFVMILRTCSLFKIKFVIPLVLINMKIKSGGSSTALYHNLYTQVEGSVFCHLAHARETLVVSHNARFAAITVARKAHSAQ